MKEKFFTLLLSALFCTFVMAQAPTAVVKRATVAPIIDGQVDPVWAGANTYNIALPFIAETPTLGDEGTTTWKALWTEEGIYVLITVNDDEFYPAYMNNSVENWMYDKPEIYFDVNAEKIDGKGGADNAGHYQIAPGFTEGSIDGTPITDNDITYAFKVTDPTYIAEYFIPFTKLLDQEGFDVDRTSPIGFDVTIIDGESATSGVRQRAVWSNVGTIKESNFNMDDCGTITLSNEMGAGGALIIRAAIAPLIDGEIDPVWETANVYNIGVPFQAETPTLGAEGSTTWKALWDHKGIYVLIQVNDNVFMPAYKGNGVTWQYDKPEIYFDVNSVKKDGKGSAPDGNNAGGGHYQFAPGFNEAEIGGGISSEENGNGATYCFKVTDPTYVAEYFIPFSKLLDKSGLEVDKNHPIGFDITIVDNDAVEPGRNRLNWNNAGAINECSGNMDDAGLITLDGGFEAIMVDKVTVTGGTISSDNGTLQMVAVISPADASSKTLKWTVNNGTGQAQIDSKGLLTGLRNGTVSVIAMAADGSYTEGKFTVTISGQKIEMSEVNFVKDGFFDSGITTTHWYTENETSSVVEGVAVIVPNAPNADPYPWDNKFKQILNVPLSYIDSTFVFSFQAWSDEARIITVDFEDLVNGYERYGDSPQGVGGKSEWTIDLTTVPTIYKFDVQFARLLENSSQQLVFMAGMAEPTFYLDSVIVATKTDLALKVSNPLSNSMKVYPNPVGSEGKLMVSLSSLNAKVSIYNAMGQKLMEKIASGNLVEFNVSSFTKGIYFIRLSDGTNQKFIKY